MRNLPILAALLLAFSVSPLLAVETLPPIEKVGIVSDHLTVNTKPFFPLMSWAQNSSRYQKLHDLGFNTHASDSADVAKAAVTGDYVVTSLKTPLQKTDRILAFIHGDEPDMISKKQTPPGPRFSPEALIEKYKQIKSADASRPVFVTFTASFMKEHSDFTSEIREKLYPQYMNAADVVGFDIYPIYGSGYAGHLNYVGNGVAELHKLAGPKRPVYAWIETSKGSQWMTYAKQPDVLPMHTRNEVWQAIINGAAGIGYFTHAWAPKFSEFAPTEDMQKELLRLNTQITQLAPAILAEPSKAAITMKLGDNLACQLKATDLADATYIFALNRDLGIDAEKSRQFEPIKPHAAHATFTVPNLKTGTRIEVVDENRTLTAQSNTFSDDFAPLAEHIYKFTR